MVKRVLMIAFHFPPFVGSSGLQRTLQFANHLSLNGWETTVLTVRPIAFHDVSEDQIEEISEDVNVVRTLAFDASRHFSIAGRYPSFLANPDPWSSWYYSAVPAARSIIRNHGIDVIWSTYPIATAHKIGLKIAESTGIPWVADLRDMMIDDDYPTDKNKRRAHLQLEEKVVRVARRVVVTTPGTFDLYSRRYPDEDRDKWICVRNGYHESDFDSVPQGVNSRETDRLEFVHSGLLYPSERDPRPFYRALAELKQVGKISAQKLRVILRATGHDRYHAELIEQFDIADIVDILPAVSHKQAIEEMVRSDGLLIFQAANCNNQVPAKIYEYFRAQRPILALTDLAGDTAATMKDAGLDDITDIANSECIKVGFEKFYRSVKEGTARVIDLKSAAEFSRQSQAEELRAVLESLLG